MHFDKKMILKDNIIISYIIIVIIVGTSQKRNEKDNLSFIRFNND